MNPIKKAISEVLSQIPRPVLERAFVDGSRYGRMNWRSSLEEQILAMVIRPRVLVDCDLLGGVEAFIPLSGLEFMVNNETMGGTLVHIPKERTGGRSITSLIALRYSNPLEYSSAAGVGSYGVSSTYRSGMNVDPTDRTALMGAAASLMSSVDNIPLTETARVDLVAENTILVHNTTMLPFSSTLHCKLANHEDMQNLQVRFYLLFSQLVVYAVKAFIYNKLLLDIGEGQLRFGQDLPQFKQVVESYSDAEQNYQDFRTQKWSKVSIMNDGVSYARYVSLRIGGNR